MVGRPKEFDQQIALERAMKVFWAHGYEATSVQDLLDAMQISRGSMYDTFGDKHALFASAMEHYGRTVTCGLEEMLAVPGSPLGNVRKAMSSIVEQALNGSCRGCLATNTAVELSQHDAQVSRAVTAILRRIEKAFQRTLQSAVTAGELKRTSDTRALARFLTGTVQGVVVMGKASASRGTLKDIVTVALSVLE